MSDHSIEGNTKVPAGLDVVPAVPGTYIGGHDMQGADGTVRTDRPGEILGSPIPHERKNAHGKEQADYIRSEVDRANREELPLLGGDVADGWEAGNAKGSKAARPATAAEEAGLAATSRAQSAPVANRAAEAAPARTTELAAPAAHGTGISVKPGIER